MAIPGYETKVNNDATLQFETVVHDWLEKALARGAGDQEKLKDLLKKKHSEYIANIEAWKTAGDIGLMRVKTVHQKKSFLVQGANEVDDSFTRRTKISAFTPETPGLLNDFIGAVFGVEAVREVTESGAGYKDKFSTFINSAGEDGSPLSNVSREALRLALLYNRVLGILDHPADQETETPYLTLQTPENLYDWGFDSKGRYQWTKFHEQRKEKAAWDGKEITVDEFRIYLAPTTVVMEEAGKVIVQRGRIVTYRILSAEGMKEIVVGPEVIDHPFASCPVIPLVWDKTGEAWSAPLIEKDLKTFRIESDHDYSQFNTANPTIKAWMHGDPEQEDIFDKLKRGSDKAIHLNPGNAERAMENVEYLIGDVGSLDHISQEAKQNREATRRLAGTGGDMENDAGNAGSPESGVAKAYQQAQREKNYKHAAHQLAEWEWKLVELVLLEGTEEDEIDQEAINIRYPSSFDMRNSQELADNLMYAREIGSATLEIEVKKKLAANIYGDGMTADMIEKINTEIEAAPTGKEETEEEDNANETSVRKADV